MSNFHNNLLGGETAPRIRDRLAGPLLETQ